MERYSTSDPYLGCGVVNTSLWEMKETYQSLYVLARQLDNNKKQISSFSQFFQHDLDQKRSRLVQLSKKVMFMDYEKYGRRALDNMWRKGYYEVIAYAKKNWHKELKDRSQASVRENLLKFECFIHEGISNYKSIALEMEKFYDFDLKYFIDCSILCDEAVERRQFCVEDLCDAPAVDKCLDAVSYALVVIQSALLSLGDLHRYILDFLIDSRLKVTKDQVAKYYFEAFKLNPAIGRSQNQLGTIYIGQNYDLDSIYHYLYSLVSLVPFELSKNNVCEIFAMHANYLGKLNPANNEFCLQDFFATLYHIVDTFFFNKDVLEIDSMCRYILVNLSKALSTKALRSNETSIFKIICILFFCLSQLEMLNSRKTHLLNAFLVAICSELMDYCIVNLEQTILATTKENEKFHIMYEQKFHEHTKRLAKEAKFILRPINARDLASIKAENGNKHYKAIKGNKNYVAKENDKNTPRSCNSQEKVENRQRYRKKFPQCDASSCSNTETDIDMDSFSEGEEHTDSSSNSDTDFSDPEEIVEDDGDYSINRKRFWDNEDRVLAEIIFNPYKQLSLEQKRRYREELLRNFELLQIKKSGQGPIPLNNNKESVDDVNVNSVEPPKIRFDRNKYRKIDPNIIVDFAFNEPTMKALKILYDWLRINHEILISFYRANPQFTHKLMKLLNYLNIDIYTRKVYFEREFLTTPNVRNSLSELFDARATVPLPEDFALKNFEFFRNIQQGLDWEKTIRDHVTLEEECIVRMSKLVDFGFFISKHTKCNYWFCEKTRCFTEKVERIRKTKISPRHSENRTVKNTNFKCAESTSRTRHYWDHKNNLASKSCNSNQERDTFEKCKKLTSSSEISISKTSNSTLREKISQSYNNVDEDSYAGVSKECEMLLQNDQKMNEEKWHKKRSSDALTPLLVLDLKALTEYLNLVNKIVKAKAYIVLVPVAVLNELESLKKHCEKARQVLHWLEQEFAAESNFLRAQRENENLILSLPKTSRKLDHDADMFFQIANFCNYLVAATSHPKESECQTSLVTYLSGNAVNEKKRKQKHVLESIPVAYDQIANFYINFTRKTKQKINTSCSLLRAICLN